MLTDEDMKLPADGYVFRLLLIAEHLDEEGWYVKANTVRAAADRLKELEDAEANRKIKEPDGAVAGERQVPASSNPVEEGLPS